MIADDISYGTPSQRVFGMIFLLGSGNPWMPCNNSQVLAGSLCLHDPPCMVKDKAILQQSLANLYLADPGYLQFQPIHPLG